MNWRIFALLMTAACGGELWASGHYIGSVVLFVFALALGAITHKWVRG